MRHSAGLEGAMSRIVGHVLAAALAATGYSSLLVAQQRAARDTAPIHAEFMDPVVEVLGMPTLRRSPGAAGRREMRLWAEGGQAVTGQLLRLVEEGGKVTGELAVYWSLDPSESGAYGGQLDAQMQAKWGCAKAAQKEVMRDGVVPLRVGACVARFRKAQDWAALLQQLQALGAWTLPDHQEAPGVQSDLESEPGIVVEVQQDGQYRTYHYPSVRSLQTDTARKAAAILDVVNGVVAAADRGGGPPR
jgi:hypothetical protein